MKKNIVVFTIVVFLIFSLSFIGFAQSRIEGGVPSPETPFVGYMFNEDYSCSVTIISYKHVATSKHCVVKDDGTIINIESFRVFVGDRDKLKDENEETIRVSKIYTFESDIAVMELSKTIHAVHVRPIVMANQQFTETFYYGWGYTNDSGATPLVLQKTSNTEYTGVLVNDPHIVCTKGDTGVMPGDSGGTATQIQNGVEVLVGINALYSNNAEYNRTCFVKMDAFIESITAIITSDIHRTQIMLPIIRNP